MNRHKAAPSLEDVFVSTIMELQSKHTYEEIKELISKMISSLTDVLDNKKLDRINDYLKSSK